MDVLKYNLISLKRKGDKTNAVVFIVSDSDFVLISLLELGILLLVIYNIIIAEISLNQRSMK